MMKYRQATPLQQPCSTKLEPPLGCFNNVHDSWHEVILQALSAMDSAYLKAMSNSSTWLPGQTALFSAFSIPLTQIRFVLLGESPYPRVESANGYAFWDQSVATLWSSSGLSKSVNRATSLRNLVKMMLVSQDLLSIHDTSQSAISQLNKEDLVQSIDQLFGNFLQEGFLLLNASLILSQQISVSREAKHWQPFLAAVLQHLYHINPQVELILFGKIADKLTQLDIPRFSTLKAEHPYNCTFIHNKQVHQFFKQIPLIYKRHS